MGSSSGSKKSIGYKYQTTIHHAVKNYGCISEANSFANFSANITRFLDICLGSTQLAQFCQNIGRFNYP